MASIETRRSNGTVTYRVRWRADGKQRSKSFRILAEARRFRANLEGDIANGTWLDPKLGAETVRSYSERWIDREAHNLAIQTVLRTKSTLRWHILPRFGDWPLSGVTTASVNDWIADALMSKAPGTVRLHVNTLSRMMAGAASEGLIKTNPCTGAARPGIKYQEQKFLTLDEAWELIDKSRPNQKALHCIAIFAGLRFGEISALRRKDILVKQSAIRVRQTCFFANGEWHFTTPKTKNSLRTVTIPRKIMRIVEAHMNAFVDQDPESLVFTARGNPYSSGNYRLSYWLPLTERISHPGLRFHDLRHTFVSLWVDLGRDPKQVSKAAGHSSVAFTLDRYGHLYEKDHETLADELDDLLGDGHMWAHDTGVEDTNPQVRGAKDDARCRRRSAWCREDTPGQDHD